MTDTKHTPGPWRVSDSRRTFVERDIPNGLATVAQCHDPSRAIADARLIASAPALAEENVRLREALEGLRRKIRKDGACFCTARDIREQHPGHSERCNRARAALAQGGQS